jgi:hypothetical protein
MFASKPQLAGSLIERAHSRGIRQRGMGYVMAVRANHAFTAGPGRIVIAAAAVGMIPIMPGTGCGPTVWLLAAVPVERPACPWPGL